MPHDRSPEQLPTVQGISYTANQAWHGRANCEHTQPTKKVELHPAPIVNPRPVPPRLAKISRHLDDSIRGSNSQHHLVQLRSSLANKTTTSKRQVSIPVPLKLRGAKTPSFTRLLHFIVKILERRVPKPRSRVINRRRLPRQRLHAIQHLDQRRDSLIIAQTPLTGKQPAR